MRIGLILDNPKRDLYGILLLAYQLIKNGHKAYIVPMYQQGYDIPLLKLDVVLMNYVRPNNLDRIKIYKKLGLRVVVLDTEGGVLSESGSDSPVNWAKSIKKNDICSFIDDYCFWGKNLYDAFVEYSGIDQDNLHLTGCPRFDLFNEQWSHVMDESRDKYVLVNTNFSSVNPNYTGGVDSEYKAFLSAGWDADYIEAVIRDFEQLFPRFIDSIKTLLRKNLTEKFIIRPHPFENADYYRNEFRAFDNVEIVSDNNIVEAISNAKCVIHLNCGSSVEAYINNILPVSIEFLNSDSLKKHTPLPSKISYGIEDVAGLAEAVGKLGELTDKFITKEKYSKYIEPWFYKNDGNAAIRVCNVLSSTRDTSRQSIRYSISGSKMRPSMLQFFQGILVNILGSRLVSAIRRRLNKSRDSKYTNLTEVGLLLKKFDKTGDMHPVSTRYAIHPLTGVPLSSIVISGPKSKNIT